MKEKHLIDPLKGIGFLIVLVMMAIYDQWHNLTAWVYLALHGTYGILWALKSRFFGDHMRKQDRSLACYSEFADWKRRTKLFIPFVF